MPARLHALVQQTDDFDEIWPNHPIVKNVNGMPDPLLGMNARMTKMHAADASKKFGTIASG
jgi:hypothetical protein